MNVNWFTIKAYIFKDIFIIDFDKGRITVIVIHHLIKAGFENITKIGGSYYDNVNKIKLAKLREEQGVDIINEDDDFVSDVDENTLEESLGPDDLA